MRTKRIYVSPKTELIATWGKEIMVTVSRATGKLSDGTDIGDGGEDDGSADPYANQWSFSDDNDEIDGLW